MNMKILIGYLYNILTMIDIETRTYYSVSILFNLRIVSAYDLHTFSVNQLIHLEASSVG